MQLLAALRPSVFAAMCLPGAMGGLAVGPGLDATWDSALAMLGAAAGYNFGGGSPVNVVSYPAQPYEVWSVIIPHFESEN
jgi:hypothetical protein